ncbi:hypothetical protein SCP_0603580 [Sparassis crispa]|uniref:Uncharacterized protein n=1 Tax=Sparassis crispa TaxID=139825 RepID=A0A401GQF1_9APHY|nr:hypothetical protein SCP_0603580 [Sparassis crispa]GBE84379.1 hypothetical protein SCP_0603580 [Sparassis crispa]
MHRPMAKAKGITFQSPRCKVALVSKKMGLDSDGRHFLSSTGIVFDSGTPPKKRKLLSIDDESLPEAGPSSALTDGPDVAMNDIASAEAEAMEDRVKNGVSRKLMRTSPASVCMGHPQRHDAETASSPLHSVRSVSCTSGYPLSLALSNKIFYRHSVALPRA